jgi:hypothetical protein
VSTCQGNALNCGRGPEQTLDCAGSTAVALVAAILGREGGGLTSKQVARNTQSSTSRATNRTNVWTTRMCTWRARN